MNGLVLLNKKQGETSFYAAAGLRKIYNTKRIGHTGTLDPMAEGVLPVLIGRATRLSSFLLDADKRYTAKIKFGIKTDTLDITGKILKTVDCDVSIEDLKTALSKFTGDIMQIPPMYSAIKQNGVRLYELARKGETAERKPRAVTVKSAAVLEKTDKNEYLVDFVCSKGTYIRSLADDIGEFLGVGATLTGLTRTATAGFIIEQCLTKEQIAENPEKALLSAHLAVPQFSDVFVSEGQKTRFLHGGELSLERLNVEPSNYPFYKVFYQDEFLGLGEISENSLKVKCVITE